jgi:hypothetical protein
MTDLYLPDQPLFTQDEIDELRPGLLARSLNSKQRDLWNRLIFAAQTIDRDMQEFIDASQIS